MKKVTVEKLLTEGVLLFFIPVYSYFITYNFYAGYYRYFGITSNLVDVSLYQFAGLFKAIFVMILFGFIFELVENVHWRFRWIDALFGLIIAFSAAVLAWGFLDSRRAIPVFIVVFIVAFLGGAVFRGVNEQIPHPDKQKAFFRNRFFKASVIVFFAVTFFSGMFGEHYAKSIVSKHLIASSGEENFLMLRPSQDIYALLPLKCNGNECKIGDDFHVLSIEQLQGYRISSLTAEIMKD